MFLAVFVNAAPQRRASSQPHQVAPVLVSTTLVELGAAADSLRR